MAAKLGFDFDKNQLKKVGVLRSFVKKKRKIDNLNCKQLKNMPLNCVGLSDKFRLLLENLKLPKSYFTD